MVSVHANKVTQINCTRQYVDDCIIGCILFIDEALKLMTGVTVDTAEKTFTQTHWFIL